jgi:hypothetical protein
VIANADDRNITQLLETHSAVSGFGLEADLLSSSQAPKYAFNFGPELDLHREVSVGFTAGYLVHHQGNAYKVPFDSASLALNYAAALLAASTIVQLDQDKVASQFASTEGVFARNEQADVLGRRVNLRLVQNPTSFQLNLDELTGDESPLMLMAGRDIHDPSWLWTVDFGKLRRVDIVGGFNAYELALRLSVAGVEVGEVLPEIPESTTRFLELEGNDPTILFSADAMRRFRRFTKVAK